MQEIFWKIDKRIQCSCFTQCILCANGFFPFLFCACSPPLWNRSGQVGAAVEKSFSWTTTKKPGVSKLPVMPNEFGVCMVYGRCCTGCDGARQAWVSRHFCLLGNFLESWVSLWFSAYADFFTFPEKVKGERRYPFWIPAFHSCISYGHLGNIWNAFCQTASLFMSLYYINNGELRFLKRW